MLIELEDVKKLLEVNRVMKGDSEILREVEKAINLIEKIGKKLKLEEKNENR
jgi:hypothetical protein